MNKMSRKKELCEIFLKGEKTIPRYMIGRSKYALQLLRVLPSSVHINGIIDEFTNETIVLGLPVIHSISDLPTNCIVINAVLTNFPQSINKRLNEIGINNIDFFSIMRYCPQLSLSIDYWNNFYKSYLSRRKEYDMIYECLSDDESRDVFYRIINFRNNFDISYMSVFSERTNEQYFEPFLNLKSNCSFIDVGGYDGYTTKEFIKRFPNYEKVWFFEPEEHNLTIAKQSLKDYERIIYCPVAASDNEGELRFEPSNDSSRISNEGSIVVKTSLIDNYIVPVKKDTDRVNHIFMKMDIEGAEGQALNGAKKTILKYHPTMAISVYHKGSDLIDIPKQVFSIRDDYKVYLRHYTEGISETVMFFVPC